LYGKTSVELYLSFAKFSEYVLYYAGIDKDIITDIDKKMDSHKVHGSLRIVWLTKVFGSEILLTLTNVPASYFWKLKNEYWNDVQKEAIENPIMFTSKYMENARQILNSFNN